MNVSSNKVSIVVVLNEQNVDIKFTRENGKLSFLNCLVSRDNNELQTTVYRKPTHTDRLLDESSYNPTSHKAMTIKTLTRRTQLVCDTPDSLSDKNNYLDRVFTGLLKLLKLTGTRHLLLQLLYPTSRALLRLLRRFYSPTTSM